MDTISKKKLASYKGKIIMIYTGDKARITKVKRSEPGMFDVHVVWISGPSKGCSENLFNMMPAHLEIILEMYRNA